MIKATKLKDLTIRDYLRFMDLVEIHNESESPNKDYDLVNAYFGDDFSDMPEAVMTAFIEEWVKDMTDNSVFDKTDEKPPQKVKIKGITFHVPQQMEHSCKISQYVDYMAYVQKYEGHSHGFYPIALAIFLKKPKELYSQIKIQDRIEFMKDCNLATAVKVCAFFFIQSKRYRDITDLWWKRNKETESTPI